MTAYPRTPSALEATWKYWCFSGAGIEHDAVGMAVIYVATGARPSPGRSAARLWPGRVRRCRIWR